MQDTEPVRTTVGPFETEAEVSAAIHLPDWQPGTYNAMNSLALLGACEQAGVALGAYDLRILTWLADFAEPQTVAVIVGIILRASEASEAGR